MSEPELPPLPPPGQEPYPAQPGGYPAPAAAPALVPRPSGVSTMRIAAAVFVGNLVCLLLTCMVYMMIFLGAALLSAPRR